MLSYLIFDLLKILFNSFLIVIKNDKARFGQIDIFLLFINLICKLLAAIFVGMFLFSSEPFEFSLFLSQIFYLFGVFGLVWLLFWLFRHFWNFSIVTNFRFIVVKAKSVLEATFFVLVSGFSVVVIIVFRVVVVLV